jgi:hypothetical protein
MTGFRGDDSASFFSLHSWEESFVFDISNFCIRVLKKEILSTSQKVSDCGLYFSIT